MSTNSSCSRRLLKVVVTFRPKLFHFKQNLVDEESPPLEQDDEDLAAVAKGAKEDGLDDRDPDVIFCPWKQQLPSLKFLPSFLVASSLFLPFCVCVCMLKWEGQPLERTSRKRRKKERKKEVKKK